MSFNELGPATREALISIGHWHYKDNRSWMVEFKRLPPGNAYTGICIECMHRYSERLTDNPSYQPNDWSIVIQHFGMLTNEIMVELGLKAKVQVKPYPHVCPVCHSPARINKHVLIVCSNTKCEVKYKGCDV